MNTTTNDSPASDSADDRPSSLRKWLHSGSKTSRFAVIGAVGCLVGAILGELLLAATRPPEADRPPQDVCLLIDCSGSMLLGNAPGEFNGQKLREVKSAASDFARRDISRDQIAVVGFGSGVHPAAKLGSNAEQLNMAIQGLGDGGSTAMDIALAAAAHELLGPSEAKRDRTAARNILLFTDGQPDNKPAALEAASVCRSQGIRILAIGTGDADMGYLAQITGDSSLVFRASAGNFGEGFKKAEKAIYGRSLVESGATQSSFFRSMLQIAAWTALLAIAVSLALIAGQNLYLHHPVLTVHSAAIGTIGGLIGGAVAGMAGQLLFMLAASTSHLPLIGWLIGGLFTGLGRIAGWAILGALVGRGLAFFVPNLDPRRAWMAGGLGGACAAVVFIIASLFGDILGRLLGAALLGAFLGAAVALVETLFRQWWLEVRLGQKEVVHVSLGAAPVRIGSDNRACTIYARGARPLAAQYQVVDNRVVYLDFAAETSTPVDVGDQRTIGHVTVTVQGKASAAPSKDAEAAAEPGKPAKMMTAAPPPPRPKAKPTASAPPPPSKPSPPPPAKPSPSASGPILSAPPPPQTPLLLPRPRSPSLDSPPPAPRFTGTLMMTAQVYGCKHNGCDCNFRTDEGNAKARWTRLITILLVFSIAVTWRSSHGCASPPPTTTANDVARTVSWSKDNRQFINAIEIDKCFEKLGIPILEGSSVLPVVTVVESIVHDEPNDDDSPWSRLSYDHEGNLVDETLGLAKLQVGPYRPQSDSEESSQINDVRTVLWPSGHVLWMVDGGDLPGALRNKKGRIVEYRFGKLDFDKTIKQIERLIAGDSRPRGYYRKAVLYEHHVMYDATKFHDLVVVGQNYRFKFVSQIPEDRDESFYSKWKLSSNQPKKNVKQFVDICGVIRSSLPKHYSTLRTEPRYVWIGRADIGEEQEIDGQTLGGQKDGQKGPGDNHQIQPR